MNVLAIIPGHIATTAILLKPLQHLHDNGQINLGVYLEEEVTNEELKSADVVVMCRNTDPYYAPLYEAIYQAKIPTVYEIDDYLLGVPIDNAVAIDHRHPRWRTQFKLLLQRATLIRAYSPTLRQVLSKYNQNTVLAEPAINWEIVPIELPDINKDPFEIVYPSARAHGPRMMKHLLYDMLQTLNYFEDNVHLHIMGFDFPELENHPQVSFHQSRNYEEFFADFTRHGYAIGLAPSRPHLFFQCKTNNKFREYAAAGTVGLYSDLPLYSSSVDHGETGLLISGKPNSWFNTIKTLIEKPENLDYIRQNARQYAEEKYSIERVSSIWMEQLGNLTPQERTISSPPRIEGKGKPTDLKVGLLTVLSILPGYVPSTIINVINPLHYLGQLGHIHFTHCLETEITIEQIVNADVIVASRNLELPYKPLFELAIRLGIPIIFDIDDNLFIVPKSIKGSEYYYDADRQSFLRWMLTHAYHVRVHSPVMKEIVEQYNTHVTRVKAPIDWSHIPNVLPETSDDPVDIVYATSRVGDDPIFELVQDELIEVLEYFGDRIRLHLMGYMPETFENYPQVVLTPYDADYQRFMKNFTSFGYAIGLAPMPLDIFHQCKTNTKFRDYAAAGAAGIYSDCPLYRDCVVHGETGLLVKNEPGHWFEAIKTLVEDAELRKKIREQARVEAEEIHNLDDFADQWLAHLEQAPIMPRFPTATTGHIETLARTWLQFKDEPDNPAAGQHLGLQEPTRLLPADGGRPDAILLVEEQVVEGAMPSLPVRQEFVYQLKPTNDSWMGIEVFVGTHQQPASGHLILEIRHAQHGLIREAAAALTEHTDNSWLNFSFDPIVNAKGQHFVLHFYLKNNDANTLVSLYQSRPPTRGERQTYRLRQRLVTDAQLQCRLIFAK